ncbi:hypothetical protein BHYA_0327g00020 [Botrytis hyacinthi]|uniref:Uncharacterized protein n=1 Tax=Botrytis hyacinthi TaxID=278943 RepID=A0A4Z1G5Q9_9HELO|nr:hypothetical protein BHYA_0327g00020 [Botrytis hyacinthi]
MSVLEQGRITSKRVGYLVRNRDGTRSLVPKAAIKVTPFYSHLTETNKAAVTSHKVKRKTRDFNSNRDPQRHNVKVGESEKQARKQASKQSSKVERRVELIEGELRGESDLDSQGTSYIPQRGAGTGTGTGTGTGLKYT